MFIRAFVLVAALTISVSAQATSIDFTDSSWATAISAGDGTTATIDNITLTSNGGDLNSNNSSSEQSGCASGSSAHDLACDGDGIGINNDEITEGGAQTITISFTDAVNIIDLLVLDLFGNEETGEIMVINGVQYFASNDNDGISGGYYATGFSGQNIYSIMLSGNLDDFSDYALAGIELSPVPLPGAFFLFSSALLGFLGIRRRSA